MDRIYLLCLIHNKDQEGIMLANQGYAAYANNKIMTASPAELTLMLYEGAIKFANLAIAGIEEKDIQKAHTNIMKVERISLTCFFTLVNFCSINCLLRASCAWISMLFSVSARMLPCI